MMPASAASKSLKQTSDATHREKERYVIPNGVLIRKRLFAFVNVCGFNHLQL